MSHDDRIGARIVRTIERPEAARLLRAVRRAGAAGEDAIEWACAALPDSRHALRLRIRRLLEDHDLASADALIARGLRLHPGDAALQLLQARSLVGQGEWGRADAAVRRVLIARPDHVETLLLAAKIARGRRDWPRAITYIRRAELRRPACAEIGALLCRTYLDAGNLGRAAEAVAQLSRPDAILEASVLAAQGRTLDAVHRLEEARSDPERHGEWADLTAELIGLLERAGPPARLRSVVDEAEAGPPALRVRAARALLDLGAWRRAVARLAPLRGHGPHQREALGGIVVAASMLGRHRLAERALERLQATRAGADPQIMADLWRRALTARTLAEAGGTRGSRPTAKGVLRGLIEAAIETFETSGAEANAEACAALLGRPEDTARVPQRAVA